MVAYIGVMGSARDSSAAETAADRLFKALGDPARRRLLDRLRVRGGLTLAKLCEGHDMTRQAVSKHLAVLAGADLVVSLRRGREKLHYLNPVPIHEISARWIRPFERARLDALRELKGRLEGHPWPKPSSTRRTSARRPKSSGRR
jgi:DNA-binding transcriptional ArsR family regulator